MGGPALIPYAEPYVAFLHRRGATGAAGLHTCMADLYDVRRAVRRERQVGYRPEGRTEPGTPRLCGMYVAKGADLAAIRVRPSTAVRRAIFPTAPCRAFGRRCTRHVPSHLHAKVRENISTHAT